MSLSKAQSADLGRSEHGAGPSSSSSQIRYAPTKQIPRASFFAIEYPGILAESSSTPSAQTQDGIGEPASVRSETSLDRALVTLAPQPAPYGTSASALAHIGTLVSHESKVLECRLPGHPLESSQSQLYRHPLLGDVVDTHNLVCRIRKRRWKRKRATAEDGSGASGGGTLQGKGKGRADAEAPGLRTGEVGQGAKGTTKPQEAREYTIEVLGVARKTARFRSMADYAFLPDVAPSAPESGSASQPSPSAPISPSPSIDLHSAMLRMDVSALRAFCFPRETEEYEIEKPSDSAEAETKISALRLIPPPFFSRTGQPFHYGCVSPASRSY